MMIINTRRACARELQYSSCLSVCYQSPSFFSSLYDKVYLPACFSLDFLGFQLTDFDKTLSFGRYSAFHGYFVVSCLDERFRIRLEAITVTWNVLLIFCQLSKFDHVDSAAAYLASDLSDYSRLSPDYQLCCRSSCTSKETINLATIAFSCLNCPS